MPNNSDDEKLKRVRRVYAFWGRFACLYAAQDLITFLGRAKAIRRRAVEKMGLTKGGRAMEVACGSGRNFPYLVKAVGQEGFILGFDYSREMLAAAESLCARNGWDNIKLAAGDAAQLKIAAGDFDGILSVLGISAIPGWEEALDRCHNLLRPGGKLVVCDARLFGGWLKIFNPLIRLIYSRFAAWDPAKDIPEKLRERFGNVAVENFNWGAFFIAVAVKTGSQPTVGNLP